MSFIPTRCERLEDRTLYSVPVPSNAINLEPIGTYQGNGVQLGAAEIVAHDPASQRLFTVNAVSATVDIISIADAANPTLVKTISVAAFGVSPNSVAVRNGIVAVAVESANKQAAGKVAFFNVDGQALASVNVGSLPDMLTFSPDGKRVLVANEGEPSNDYTVDPEGTVSIIDLPANLASLVQANVRTAAFTAFNAQKAALQAAGVRIFGPDLSTADTTDTTTVAQDLEPEYVAVSADSKTAFVTLQENNAYGVIDLDTGVVQQIIPFGLKDFSRPVATADLYPFPTMPVLGQTAAGQDIPLGGFSGLTYEGKAPNGNLKFLAHTDRGPNAEPTGVRRPFLLPDFAPELIRFELNPTTGQVAITQRIQLKDTTGTPLSGLPNSSIVSGDGNTPYNDETAVDLFNNVIPNEPLSGDFEGIAVDPTDGTFWMVDEYRPALYHFDTTGKLIERFVPQGTVAAYNAGRAPADQVPAGTFGTEALPAIIANRRQNRGFEGVAFQDGKVYAFAQSPIRNPATLANGALNSMRNVRIVEFDPITKTTTRQFMYIMDNRPSQNADDTRADKLGDAVAIGNGEFLVVERDDDAIDSDARRFIDKKVYKFSLAGATDIAGLDGTFDIGGGVLKSLDQMTAAELVAKGVTPIGKKLHVDLVEAGFNTVEKIEGLALVDADTLAVVNDNDFTVASITVDNATGTFVRNAPGEDTTLGIIHLRQNSLDPSDRDTAIAIAQHPVQGMYMPDAIQALSAAGKTYLVTANEGDSRAYAGFSEEIRVGAGGYVLDPTVFPNAAALKDNAVLGRLQLTRATGDLDGDGDFDQIHHLGARSFSIFTPEGQLIFDSGDDFEQIIAQKDPASFNASNDNNTFDDRSDNKGPEPEGVVLGIVNGRTYAFVGLERMGGVMVYDVTDPKKPVFVRYVNNRDLTQDVATTAAKDLGPEGLSFIPAASSPNGQPLLAVANEVSGSVTLYQIGQAVTRFLLIDVITQQPLQEIRNGDKVNLGNLKGRPLSIQAITTAGGVGSVRFGFDGASNYRTETKAPYGLFGDSNGKFLAGTLSLGKHSLSARAYSGPNATGVAGGFKTVSFTVVDAPIITAFALVKPGTKTQLRILTDGGRISLSELTAGQFNIRIDTSPLPTGSVRFSLDGNANFRTESSAPYSLFGDSNGTFLPGSLSLGFHTLTATPFKGLNGAGAAGIASTLKFEIVA